MGFVLTQVALQRIIQKGLAEIKNDISVLDEIFTMYKCPLMIDDYGQSYIEDIKTWFQETRIPVVQAWSFNATRVPGISIHLSQESEDETRAAINDMGFIGETDEVGIGVFNVNLDVGIHTSRTGDEALWLYYIVSYCLFTQKRFAEDMGLYLQTFNGSDYGRAMEKLPDNIWTRWIRYRCTVDNQWTASDADDVFGGIDTTLDTEII